MSYNPRKEVRPSLDQDLMALAGLIVFVGFIVSVLILVFGGGHGGIIY